MKGLLIFLGLLVSYNSGDWHSFKLQHKKMYTNPLEEFMRMAVFETNRIWIEKHNEKYEKGLVPFKLSMNKFGDMTDEEFGDLYLNADNSDLKYAPGLEPILFSAAPSEKYPENVNWTKLGGVTPVIDQGSCGACWAFSALGALEGQIFRKTGNLEALSVQNLVDCSRKLGNRGCKGGMPLRAFKYVLQYGVETEKSYPFLHKEGRCKRSVSNSGPRMKKLVQINPTFPEREKSLMEVVATIGPVSVCIWSGKLFRFYSDGILFDKECLNNKHVNHAVLLVGYGKDNGTDYWLVKNTWGSRWGKLGYAKIARNKADHCNIASHGVFPIL